jgi:hypothetical protein
VRDEEKFGLPITKYMKDNVMTDVTYYSDQVLFQKFLVKPLFVAGNQYLGGEIDDVIGVIDVNLRRTQEYADELKAKEDNFGDGDGDDDGQ